MFTESIASGFSVGIPRLLRGKRTDKLVYIELVGPRANVRANWAAMKGSNKRPLVDGMQLVLNKQEHVVVKKTLPSGWDHWAMLNKQASIEEMDPTAPFYLIAWEYEGGHWRDQPMPANFIPMLDKALPLPIRPAWADYLWHNAQGYGVPHKLIHPIGSFAINLSGWKVNNDAEKWEDVIRSGFQSGAISF